MIHIEQIELFRVSLSTRLPFRYGIAEMRELPHMILRLQARIGKKTYVGHSADHLPPHWFSKRAEQTQAEEIEELLKEISGIKAPKITKGELKTYLEAFPKEYSNKEIQFLMNGQGEMDSKTLYELLKST